MKERFSPNSVFVIDSSSWFQIEGHPAHNQILSVLVALIEADRIKVPKEVLDEIELDDELFSWLKPYKQRLVENNRSDPVYFRLVGQITSDFPAMVGILSTRNRADPWVIATAAHKNGLPFERVVVCDESVRRRANRKIPTACAAYGIKCITLLQMLEAESPDGLWNQDN